MEEQPWLGNNPLSPHLLWQQQQSKTSLSPCQRWFSLGRQLGGGKGSQGGQAKLITQVTCPKAAPLALGAVALWSLNVPLEMPSKSHRVSRCVEF